MFTTGRISLCVGLMGVVLALEPAPACAQSSRSSARPHLIVLSHDESHPTEAGPLLQLIRQRLPLGVHLGRFVAEEGESSFCIFSRRRLEPAAVLPGTGGDSLPVCPMISVYVDGTAIKAASSFLAAARALDLESIELVRDVDAYERYGIFDEVLVLWTKGQGPYARPARMTQRATLRH